MAKTYIAWPTDALSQQLVGGKAAALSRLRTFQIPPWFAITCEAFIDANSKAEIALDSHTSITSIPVCKELRQQIDEAVLTLSDNQPDGSVFAVRSSALGEDGSEASYAGQLHSFLNVPANEIAHYVEKVWLSALSSSVKRYTQQSGSTTSLLPAVIVQRMIPAEKSGVAFSADPVTNTTDRMIISATPGLGDQLVSGAVSGDTYYVFPDGRLQEAVCLATPVLSSKELQDIALLMKNVSRHQQSPQDIEWAICDGTLWLLQSRPITTLSPSTRTQINNETIHGTEPTYWDNSNIVESYSGITSPLTFSFARYVYENVYIEFCRIMGVPASRIAQKHTMFRNMLGLIKGHVYYNLRNWYQLVYLFPGAKINGSFMEQMMGVKEGLPEHVLQPLRESSSSFYAKVADFFALVCSCAGLIWNFAMLPRKTKAFYGRLDDALKTPISSLATLPLDKLAQEYRLLEAKLLRSWDAPLINDFCCMIAFGLSRKLLEKYWGEAGLAYHRDMLIGQGDIISAEPAKRIQQLASLIQDKPEVIAACISSPASEVWEKIALYPELHTLVTEYLELFGDRCLQELKLESLTMRDNPTTFFTSIGYFAEKLAASPQQPSVSQQTQITFDDLPGQSSIMRWCINKLVVAAKYLVRNRENMRFERTRVFGRVRAIFLQIGDRLAQLHKLNDKRDIFYLEVNEILNAIEGTATCTSFADLVAIRKKEQSHYATLPAPPSRLVTYGAVCCAHMPTETTVDRPTDTSQSKKGIGCCQGIVTARVRVIDNPQQAQLQSGEILVAKFTDPGWITLFANAAGILVERGSLLSHSAIVARELNIPAIVAIDGVTTWLKTGDMVEMNGASGIVRRIEE